MQTLQKKYITFVAVALLIVVASCKKDEPFVKPKLSFAKSEMTVNESDKTIKVEMILDKAYSEDVFVSYTLKGTAQDEATETENTPYPDYKITKDYLNCKIPAGETSGFIEIEVYSDFEIEEFSSSGQLVPETIEIAIVKTDKEEIEITRQDDITVSIVQEDGLIAFLEWPTKSTAGYADMDILVRYGKSKSEWIEYFAGSFLRNDSHDSEYVFLPAAILPDVTYGFSYIYHDGTIDPLKFTVTYIDLLGGNLEPVSSQKSFTGTYTAVNKNPWVYERNKPIPLSTANVEQVILKSGGKFGDPDGDILIPSTGSRISGASIFPSEFERKKSRNTIPVVLQNYIR